MRENTENNEIMELSKLIVKRLPGDAGSGREKGKFGVALVQHPWQG